jgi:FKBP-type peptidyl-prolyl cis-trans isomerase
VKPLLTATLVVLAGVASAACAQETPPPPKPQSLVERASYAIGLNLARNLKGQEVPVAAEQLVQGLRDGLAGSPAALSDEEIQTTMQAFQQEVQTRQAEQKKQAGAANQTASDAFLAQNKTQPGVVTTASGLQYQVLVEGSGPTPKATDQVKVHYRGTLPDGTVFDSSYDRGQPAVFGVTQVIPGWVEALQLMKVGSKWKLAIPPALAYAERGTGQAIGPHQALVFEVELLGIEPQG